MNVEQRALPARPLGSLETLLWLANQKSPKHFAVAAEIAATPAEEDWRAAIDAAQRRHPLCQVGIVASEGQGANFHYHPDARIPVQIIADPDGALLAGQFEAELAAPFLEADAVLMRATILEHRETSTLLVTVHHAIGDGLSAVFWIRDVVRALAGERLEADHLPGAQEDGFGSGPAVASNPASPYREPRLGTLDQRNRSDLRVNVRRLPEDLGSLLRQQARAAGSTVHGAIVAAIMVAGAERDPSLACRPLNLMSPVNARPLLDRGEGFGIAFATAVGDVGPVASEAFWAMARQANSINSPLRTKEGLAAFFAALGGFVASRPSVDDAIQLERQLFPIDFMISNLGILPFSTRIAGIDILSLFGPAMILGMKGEQMIGIATIGSAIHFTHSSYSPIPGLLEATEAHLRRMTA